MQQIGHSTSLDFMSRTKYWCFTINNYTEDEFDQLGRLECGALITYLICGKERGDTGTPHLQGYIELATRQRIRGVKLIPGMSRAHVEPRKGTAAEASTYCTKDGDYFEIGDISKSPPNGGGAGADLAAIVQAAIEGRSMRDLWAEFPVGMVRHHRGIRELIANTRENRFVVSHGADDFKERGEGEPRMLHDNSVSHVIIGPSGTGKTSYAKAMYPKALLVSHMDDLGDFDPTVYEAIIFDDMSFLHMPRSAQIHIVDVDEDRSIHIRYKTAFIPRGTKKIFTTNEDIFLDDPAINRRLKYHRITEALF